jgi:large subunit ribosomal protein L17
MRHRVAGRKLGRTTGERTALLRGLAGDLLRYEKIETTEAKAKALRGVVERIITLGKRGDLHARRQAYAKLYHTEIVDKVFHVLAPRYADRPGGYTRVVKLPPRRGDGASMAVIALVE